MHGKNHILITSYKRFITTKWMAVNVPGKNLLYISCHFSMTNLFCIYLVCCQCRYHYLPTYPSYLRKSFGPLFQTTQGPRVVKHHQAFGETRLWHFSKSIWEIPVTKFGSWKRNQQFLIKEVLKVDIYNSTNHRAPHNQWHSEKSQSLDNSHIRRHPKKVS